MISFFYIYFVYIMSQYLAFLFTRSSLLTYFKEKCVISLIQFVYFLYLFLQIIMIMCIDL